MWQRLRTFTSFLDLTCLKSDSYKDFTTIIAENMLWDQVNECDRKTDGDDIAAK